MIKLQKSLVGLIALLAVTIVASLATAIGAQTPNETADYSDAGVALSALNQAQSSLSAAQSAVANAKASVQAIRDRNVPPPPTEEPPVEEPPVSGQVLFRDDFNSIPAAHGSGNGWYSQCNPGRMTTTGGVVRFEVRASDRETDTGHPRCELSGAGPDIKEGDSVWVASELRWSSADTATPPWELIQQWHDDGCCSPPVAFFRYGTNKRLINGNGSPVYWNGGAVEKGVWGKLLYHLNVGNAGHIEIWWNGTKVADQNADLLNSPSLYLKIGINRSNDTSGGGTSVVEYDKLVIATTRAAAEG